MASAALVVMLSTVVSTIDGLARVYATFTARLLYDSTDQADVDRWYGPFLAVQFIAACACLLLLMRSFLTFIDIATTTSFLVAPVLAYFNYRALFGGDVAEDQLPSRMFRYWSLAGIALLGTIAFAFITLKIID